MCHFAAPRLSALTTTNSQLTLVEYLSHEPAPPFCLNLNSCVAWGPICMVAKHYNVQVEPVMPSAGIVEMSVLLCLGLKKSAQLLLQLMACADYTR